MARAQGARSQMALAFETVYGTPPVSGFKQVPFASTSLGGEQPLLDSELLGFGRDPMAPIKDALNADGDVVIPIDVENFGFWLKAAFGQPVTTGTTPKIHTFSSGGFTLPSMSIETQMPEVPRFAMYSGCMVDEIGWEMRRSGLLTATAKLIAQGETVAGTTAAGTLTAQTLQRFGHFNGSITRDAVAYANITSARINYKNGLERIDSIRADGKIDGLDPAKAMLSGTLEARFADLALFNQAIAGTPCTLVFTHTLSANASFTLTAHEVYLPRPRVSIEGPGGIQATFDWQAAKAVLTPFRMCTAVLTNTVASY